MGTRTQTRVQAPFKEAGGPILLTFNGRMSEAPRRVAQKLFSGNWWWLEVQT